MRITIASTAEGCEGWLLELDVEPETTVGQLKTILAQPPHQLSVKPESKVLGRLKGQLATLFDYEKVHPHMTLLNINSDRLLRFPDGFLWGSATAAYQVEGAVTEGGRSRSIWDTFCAEGRAANGETGAVACDHYHRFREDVKIMKDLGLRAYRFSIAWPRILPNGRGEVNQEAVAFYSELIDELRGAGIEPFVTLYHWDLPQCLEDEYGGWLGRKIVDDFEEYAAVCFREFGDRVTYWLTINEPWCMSVLGYSSGEHAPGRTVNAAEEPYLATHHVILAHARAVRRYRREFQESQEGFVGIALNMDWKEPLTQAEEDLQACRRAIDWQLSWFMDPICKGCYPSTMTERVGDRLPTFSEPEVTMITGTLDFLGLNHYSSDYVADGEHRPDEKTSYFNDMGVVNTPDPLWPKTDMGWDIVPWGLQRLLSWIQKEYAPPGGIYITENGCAVREDNPSEALKDTARVEYLQGYLAQTHRAIEEGVQVKGYLVWSFMDNFEWAFGYGKRFGIVRVDYTDQKRTPKASAKLMSETSKSNVLRVSEKVLDASEYSPFNTKILYRKKPEQAPEKKPTKPTITPAEAKKMLQEFVQRYQDGKFQAQMTEAFRQYMMTNDEIALTKARQLICLPIQMDVLPKYGFEPTRRGVAQATAILTAMKQTEIMELHVMVQYFTKELPHTTALEGAVG